MNMKITPIPSTDIRISQYPVKSLAIKSWPGCFNDGYKEFSILAYFS